MANQPKKYKKFVATAATATLVASAIVPVASAASLSDIAGNTHEEAINALVDAKVISGYPDGTFKPNKTLTRSDVVKLLGKYLVAEGYEIPSDAVSNPRFSDLSSKSNKELLEYAAVVADNGVFNGSNGKLLAGDNITRENMAIVLVRMVNTLKDVSLEEYVDAQNFKGDVKDLNAAKAEARTAIKVLDFYDITNPSVANFNPKGDTTRGQFATFLHKTINTDFAGAAVTGTVKAINATTVEVTFGEDVKDIKALDFAISGLEVSNAVIKQSDKKTVVLTTSPQTAGVEYTVTVNGDKVGKFIGISAVIPTAVNIVEKSLQAPVGTQVTLKAQVTVAEGQSKAGIPVTFNIVNNSNVGTALLNQPIVAEAKTDENGVATYTYTRYAQTSYQIASYDEVQVYATGKPTARSFSKVYWANIQPLTLTEVTQGNEIQNGGKKVYRVTAATEHVEYISDVEYKKDVAGYNAKGVYSAGHYVNVGYRENTDVTPDKAKKKVDVIDASGRNLGYPGQYLSSTSGANNPTTNNWVKEIKIKLDDSGQAIFTLSGLDESVTPFVFVDQKNKLNNALETVGRNEATELFAQAPTVKFGKIHSLVTTLTAIGEQYAASFYNPESNDRIANNLENYLNRTLSSTELKAALVDTGGRDYKITITDKNGKLAPKGTKVGLDVAIGSAFRTDGGAVYLVDNNTRTIIKLTDDAAKGNSLTHAQKLNLLTTDAKGEVSFTLIGYKDAYATPEIVINSGNDQAKIDDNDQKSKGEIVYFSDARVSKAAFNVSKAQASADRDDFVEFIYQTVDQNGKAYRPHNNNLDLDRNGLSDNYVPVSFEISTVFNEVKATPGQFGLYKRFENLTGANQQSVIIGPDSMGNHFGGSLQYRTLVLITDEFGRASVKVSGIDGRETSVNVTASTTLSSLPQLLTASAQLIGNNLVPATYEGIVTAFNPALNTITFAGKSPISYTASNAIYFNGAVQVTEQEFEKLLNDADGTVVVKRELTSTGNKFTIVSSAKTGIAPKNEATSIPVDKTALDAAIKAEEAKALKEADYTQATWTAYATALDNAKKVLANEYTSQATVDAVLAQLAAAEKALELKVEEAIEGVEITSADGLAPSQTAGLLGLFTGYEIAGTVSNTDITTLTLTYTFDDETVAPLVRTVTVTDGAFADTLGAQAYSIKEVKVTSPQAKGSVSKPVTTKVTK